MTESRYKELRKKDDFMYLFFKEESGKDIPKQMFDISFNTWLTMIIGVDPNTGVRKIFTFLDKKFGYSKDND